MSLVEICHKFRVELDPEEVWRCMGPAGGARSQLTDEVIRWSQEAAALSSPRAAARGYRMVDAARGRVRLTNGPELQGKFVTHLFDGARGAVFLLATAGPGLEDRVAQLFEEDRFVEALVLDAAASAAAMNVFTQLAEEVVEALGEDVRIGPCIRPGTDVWSIEGQRVIFEALPADDAGVMLLPSLLMSPQKSQSGVIAYGEDLRVIADPEMSPCRACSAVRCPMRVEEYAGPLVGS